MISVLPFIVLARWYCGPSEFSPLGQWRVDPISLKGLEYNKQTERGIPFANSRYVEFFENGKFELLGTNVTGNWKCNGNTVVLHAVKGAYVFTGLKAQIKGTSNTTEMHYLPNSKRLTWVYQNPKMKTRHTLYLYHASAVSRSRG